MKTITVTLTLSPSAAAQLDLAHVGQGWSVDSVVSDIVEEWATRHVPVPEDLQWAIAPEARA